MQVVCSRTGNSRPICFDLVLLSSGYHNRTPHTGWLTEQTCIFLTVLKAEESEIKVLAEFVSPEASLLGLPVASSLCVL